MGDQLVDEYLAFVAARARRNTRLAVASDLKIFFETVGKRPVEVTAADVFEFLTVQRRPRRGQNVVGLDGETGLAARTIARRLSSVRGKTMTTSYSRPGRSYSPWRKRWMAGAGHRPHHGLERAVVPTCYSRSGTGRLVPGSG